MTVEPLSLKKGTPGGNRFHKSPLLSINPLPDKTKLFAGHPKRKQVSQTTKCKPSGPDQKEGKQPCFVHQGAVRQYSSFSSVVVL